MTTAKRVANGDLQNRIYSSRNENRRVMRSCIGTYTSLLLSVQHNIMIMCFSFSRGYCRNIITLRACFQSNRRRNFVSDEN